METKNSTDRRSFEVELFHKRDNTWEAEAGSYDTYEEAKNRMDDLCRYTDWVTYDKIRVVEVLVRVRELVERSLPTIESRVEPKTYYFRYSEYKFSVEALTYDEALRKAMLLEGGNTHESDWELVRIFE